jgi:hypothetical protein
LATRHVRGRHRVYSDQEIPPGVAGTDSRDATSRIRDLVKPTSRPFSGDPQARELLLLLSQQLDDARRLIRDQRLEIDGLRRDRDARDRANVLTVDGLKEAHRQEVEAIQDQHRLEMARRDDAYRQLASMASCPRCAREAVDWWRPEATGGGSHE